MLRSCHGRDISVTPPRRSSFLHHATHGRSAGGDLHWSCRFSVVRGRPRRDVDRASHARLGQHVAGLGPERMWQGLFDQFPSITAALRSWLRPAGRVLEAGLDPNAPDQAFSRADIPRHDLPRQSAKEPDPEGLFSAFLQRKDRAGVTDGSLCDMPLLGQALSRSSCVKISARKLI